MVLEALLLGLSTGVYCVITCAPLTLPFLFALKTDPRRNAALVGVFLAGRLAGYLTVGAILGLSGFLLLNYLDPELERVLSLIAYGLAGAVLLVQGLSYTGKFRRLCAILRVRAFKRNALLLGLVSGLSICPPFLVAAGRVLTAVGSGTLDGAAGGAVFFLFFFLGTAVFFLPLFGVPLFHRWRDKLANIARVAMLLMGVYFLGFLCLLEIIKEGTKHV
jgi:sulfite exporter TauE/SafE